ncbi:AAA family ATPase [Thermanaerosceptrum fracticalcis]|nr:AAA family ATPase [Thermanaerosceptrum fracticalcis]
MKRRLLLARALMHQPELLVLDEPTAGLDPEIRQEIWQLLLELNRQGMTMLLTTHYLEEAEILCQRIVFMYQGQVVREGRPGELAKNLGQFAVEIKGREGMEVHYFPSHEKARAYLEKEGREGKLRRVKLEPSCFMAVLSCYAAGLNKRKKKGGLYLWK